MRKVYISKHHPPFPLPDFFSLGRLPELSYLQPPFWKNPGSAPGARYFQAPATRAKVLANPAARVAVKSRIPSRNFAFSRIPDSENTLSDPNLKGR